MDEADLRGRECVDRCTREENNHRGGSGIIKLVNTLGERAGAKLRVRHLILVKRHS